MGNNCGCCIKKKTQTQRSTVAQTSDGEYAESLQNDSPLEDRDARLEKLI